MNKRKEAKLKKLNDQKTFEENNQKAIETHNTFLRKHLLGKEVVLASGATFILDEKTLRDIFATGKALVYDDGMGNNEWVVQINE